MQNVQTQANSNQVAQPQTKVVNVANKEPATRGVKNVFMFNDERLYTMPELMAELNIKARATADKYIEIGVLKPLKARGRPRATRGRRMLFKASALETLRKYMSRHGRIIPPGIEKVASNPVKKVSKPTEAKVATKSIEAPKKRKSIAKKADIIARLDEQIAKVEHLEEVIKALSTDIRGMSQTH